MPFRFEYSTASKGSVEDLKCDLIDIVNSSEGLAANAVRSSTKQKPLFQNPTDIPSYDAIDIIEVVQVHEDPSNDSITSTDEFVPEVIDSGIALNLENPTNHLS